MKLYVTIFNIQEHCTSIELEYAIEVTRGLQTEMNEFGNAAQRGQLTQVPGETAETSTAQLNQVSEGTE